ncbi:MAG: protein kinase [Gemmatimonadota bacterium]|nr:protein kinase [Gemmatimonadota bacterium]MDH3366661.1 protein kinase [Gemmatimonadota bacterium]MDH3478450.1 protein kinase [Gemmatimonadota bacterium]MDH3568962.1 protein kinase [Gemmatimonadota bacterium]MDH5549669.1 protein kinase [Gemmatimonadota bacterium]
MTDPSTAHAPAPDPISGLRHDLRTPVNHILGYAEMLLEDAEEPTHAERRRALRETVRAARDVLGLIKTALPASRDDIAPEEIGSLYDSLREPQGKILSTMRDLLTSDGGDAAFREDIQRIIKAAERLAKPDAAVTSTAAAAEVAKATEAGSTDRGAAHVLVVDDDEDNREVLRRRLERNGYQVGCAEDGSRALEMLTEQAYDLVLLDVMMPQLDGYQVLERMKGTPATRDIPVIMISALDDVSSVVRCIERGAEDYLPKPFDPILLRARISASLEKKRLRDQEVQHLERVAQIIEAAKRMEAGSYRPGTLADLGARDDELGQLARVFDGMAQQVRAREDQLRDRIRDLRSEIEAARTTPADAETAVNGGNLSTGEAFAERYEVVSLIGRGGMGSVYRARDRELLEDVAVKTLLPQLVADETVIERFKQEIRLARRISHRNVVRTHDFGQWGGVYYLTMEYVEGITVRALIDSRGQLGVPSTLAIGMQLAEALSVAHEQGVIHRDIKPQNLLLDPEGVLKVMDFGVARLAKRQSAITEVGLVVGTPAYMSPEQLLAETVDARSDLYATGVVLYECLTGRIPFEASSPVTLIAKLLHEEPTPPAEVNRDIPPALSSLLVRLLAKKPEDRVQSAADLMQRLREIA